MTADLDFSADAARCAAIHVRAATIAGCNRTGSRTLHLRKRQRADFHFYEARSTGPDPGRLESLHSFRRLFTASGRFAACYDRFPEHMVQQPRSLEGASRGI